MTQRATECRRELARCLENFNANNLTAFVVIENHAIIDFITLGVGALIEANIERVFWLVVVKSHKYFSILLVINAVTISYIISVAS